MAEERYVVLARKWRPQRFDDVVGQEHITRTLKNALASGRIHHAFLFIGSRGIGKTTSARILAKALNCLAFDKPTPDPCGECDNCVSIGAGTNIDVIEIDGASNNGVDDVREIRDNIRMVPSHGRRKVYIIDEVHQLSGAAFNALLKTLEEPPPHAVFILATTEAHKIPATIISRCQRYDFRRVAINDLIALLQKILDDEGRTASEEALHAMSRAAEGGVRDAESILDEMLTYCDGEITFKAVFEMLGLVDWNLFHQLTGAILDKDIPRQLQLVEDVVAGGKDLTQFVNDVLLYFRNLLVCKTADPRGLLHLPEDEIRGMQEHAGRFTMMELIRLVEQFAQLSSGFDSQLAQRIALEALLIRISKAGVEVSVDSVLEKLLRLEEGGGAGASRAAAKPKAGEPPPNPRQAGPAEPAPAAPAMQQQRATVTEANLRERWQSIVEELVQDDLNLGLRLNEAVPVGIEDGVVTLQFAADAVEARSVAERPGCRAAIEEALAKHTENLRSFRTALAAPMEVREAGPEAESGAGPGFYSAVNAEDARAAFEDPLVSKVMEVFKGRIAKVRRADGAADAGRASS